MTTKICTKCGLEQPIENFAARKDRRSNRARCNDCAKKYHVKYFKEKYRETLYGLTLVAYNALLEQQKHVCAICGLPEVATTNKGVLRQLSVDHDHTTGNVRALLCSKCNMGLGLFKDDPSLLIAASTYLRAHAVEIEEAA